jgi:hypothetical protein
MSMGRSIVSSLIKYHLFKILLIPSVVADSEFLIPVIRSFKLLIQLNMLKPGRYFGTHSTRLRWNLFGLLSELQKVVLLLFEQLTGKNTVPTPKKWSSEKATHSQMYQDYAIFIFTDVFKV